MVVNMDLEKLVVKQKIEIERLNDLVKSLCDIINTQRYMGQLGMDMRREIELELYQQKSLNSTTNINGSKQIPQ